MITKDDDIKTKVWVFVALAGGRGDLGTEEQGALSRRLLFYGAKEAFGEEICADDLVKTPQGRPQIRGGGLRVSISHCGYGAAVSLSRGVDCGVDIEGPRKIKASTAKRVFGDNERAGILSALERAGGDESDSDYVNLFLRAWTVREAAAKMEGRGLSRDILERDIAEFSPDCTATREQGEGVVVSCVAEESCEFEFVKIGEDALK
ncbi:MAG: 4'-phosphopantetheinyl transferase superfamily protein [Eubacterium sp.]|nr:4'-phosphopantetheinyl transferase superfamily protein [Eubacterium sp.]